MRVCVTEGGGEKTRKKLPKVMDFEMSLLSSV